VAIPDRFDTAVLDAEAAAALYDRLLAEAIAALPADEQMAVTTYLAERESISKTYWRPSTAEGIWHLVDDEVTIALALTSQQTFINLGMDEDVSEASDDQEGAACGKLPMRNPDGTIKPVDLSGIFEGCPRYPVTGKPIINSAPPRKVDTKTWDLEPL